MADVRFNVDTEFMDNLREKLKAKGNVAVMREAFTLLNWCVNESKNGRRIFSGTRNGEQLRELGVDSLKRIREQAAPKPGC